MSTTANASRPMRWTWLLHVCLASHSAHCGTIVGFPVESHALFPVTFELWFSYLRAVAPLGFFCEQVVGFNRKITMDPQGNVSGQSYLGVICRKCAEMGFSARVVMLQANIWNACERPRSTLGRVACSEIALLRCRHGLKEPFLT